MFLSTPHAHTTYVDGKSSPREMVEAAVALGFSSLGFSEHAEQPNEPKYGLTPENEAAYIAGTRALAEEYAARVRLRLGLERDALSPAERSKYEYVIGSVHYVERSGGEFVGVDGPSEGVARALETDFHSSGLAYAKAYYETLGAYIEGYRPEIIGHFDLLRKWNARLGLFDSGAPAYRRAALTALERAFSRETLLEVNTGGIARGYMNDPYPEAFLLARWREMGGRVILSSDCHLAEKLACGLDIARELCRSVGYRTVWALGTGDELFEEYPL